MVGNDADTNNSPSQNNNTGSYDEYLELASQACTSGNVVLGLHLYLAAYEKSVQDSYVPDPAVIEGLRRAWAYTCSHKERSLAEYIFEKLEPYLSSEEVAQYASQLQRLALDKLEEFGLTREDLEDMTDMISQDFFGMDPSTFLMRIESGVSSRGMLEQYYKGLTRDNKSEEDISQASSTEEPSTPPSEKLNGEAVGEKSGGETASKNAGQSSATREIKHFDEDAGAAKSHQGNLSENVVIPEQGQSNEATFANSELARLGLKPLNASQLQPGSSQLNLPELMPSPDEAKKQSLDSIGYRDLVGYEEVIKTMGNFGIGMQDDFEFQEFVSMLNKKHGLSKMPVTGSFLFKSPVREDANHFMIASMNEVGLPAIRMRMEENLQGMPVLCVMTSTENQPKINTSRTIFEGGGVLVLEDIDLWGSPLFETGNEELNGFIYAQLSRGAREAINLMRSAIENPDVYVFVSAAQDSVIDPFFLDLLEPLTLVDIELPTVSERSDLWANIAKEHPSLRSIDRKELVRYSAGMSRFDIYMAARETVEDAYKASLVLKRYSPITTENIFEKIAAYQPLDSTEYQELEDAVVESFKTELEGLDDLLKGSGNKE